MSLFISNTSRHYLSKKEVSFTDESKVAIRKLMSNAPVIMSHSVSEQGLGLIRAIPQYIPHCVYCFQYLRTGCVSK